MCQDRIRCGHDTLCKSIMSRSAASHDSFGYDHFGKLGPSAESYLKSLADVACSTGFVGHGVWLRVAKQFLTCALVRGRGVVFRHYYKSIAKCAGKDYRDGAVVPFE